MSDALLDLSTAYSERCSQMGMKEGAVWNQWVIQYAKYFDHIGENVPVYWQLPPGVELDSVGGRVVRGYPYYRVDAIAVKDGNVDIIEVKESGNMTAIGQLMSYEVLFQRTYTGFKTLTKRLVCGYARAEIENLCRILRINIDIVNVKG